MARTKQPLPSRLAPLATILLSSSLPPSSMNETAQRRTESGLSPASSRCRCQHCSSSETHGPANRPSKSNETFRLSSLTDILSIEFRYHYQAVNGHASGQTLLDTDSV